MAQWQCPICDLYYPDYYRGPDNHYLTFTRSRETAPRTWEGGEVCHDCWSIHWELYRLEISWPRDRRHHKHADKYTKAAYLLYRGYKQSEIARAMGVHRNTVANWRRRISRDVNLFSKIESLVVQKTPQKLFTLGETDGTAARVK